MITVTLIGTDGAGKTTMGPRLHVEQRHQFKYIYMGINTDASNLVFPATRLVEALNWIVLIVVEFKLSELSVNMNRIRKDLYDTRQPERYLRMLGSSN